MREGIGGEKEEGDEAGDEREGREEHHERDEGRVSVLTHLNISFSLSLLCLRIYCLTDVNLTVVSMLSNF
jgi:hypothetical protein